MTTPTSRHWSTGPTRSDQPAASAGKSNRDDVKLLAKLESSLSDGERMVERQARLLAELSAAGSTTTEATRSLARLEAAVHERRDRRDAFVSSLRETDEARSDTIR